MPMRQVTFASCYVYSPVGSDLTSERSRLMRALLKASDARFMPRYAVRVRQEVRDAAPLAGYFDESSVLVPIPGCAPNTKDRPSVAEVLAEALLEEGLGRSLWPGLRRMRAVRKSATAVWGTRPTVDTHYDSFALEACEPSPRHIILIDDVVTKGRTLFAAALRVHAAFPEAQIRAFALVRTMGFVERVDRLVDPCVGRIVWKWGDACREP
jgi:hypothetical protein